MPPELMQLIAGGAGKSAPAMPQPGGEQAAGPAQGGAPMTTPQPAAGEKQNAMVNVTLAMDLPEEVLPALGSESDEGQAVLDVLSKLSKKFGHTRAKSQELVPAELMQLFQNLPQQGGMSQEAKAMGQQPAMQIPGMPGAQPQPMAA